VLLPDTGRLVIIAPVSDRSDLAETIADRAVFLGLAAASSARRQRHRVPVELGDRVVRL
jgi:hypothetical protein